MKNIQAYCYLLFIVLLMSGCSTHQAMEPYERYHVPNFSDMMPAQLVVISMVLPESLDVPGTALYEGLPPSINFPVYLVRKDAEKAKEAMRLLGVRYRIPNTNEYRLLVYTLMTEEERLQYAVFTTDPDNLRVYGQSGHGIKMSDWEDKRPKDYPELFTPITEVSEWVVCAKKGSKEYMDLIALLSGYMQSGLQDIKELVEDYGEYYEKYEIPIGSILPENVLKEVMKNKEFISKAKELLFKDWKIIGTIPLITMEQELASIFLIKVFQVPGKFFGDDLNQEGYLSREMDARGTWAMIDYREKNYGFSSRYSPEDEIGLRKAIELVSHMSREDVVALFEMINSYRKQ